MPRDQKTTPAEIPTAPMADIAFLLIVFFMLTTVLSSNRGIEHLLPARFPEGEPIESVVIYVLPSGGYEMDGRHYTGDQIDRVRAHLVQTLQSSGNKPVILMADDRARYGDMVEVFDQVKQAEVEMGPGYSVNLVIPTRKESEVLLGMMDI